MNIPKQFSRVRVFSLTLLLIIFLAGCSSSSSYSKSETTISLVVDEEIEVFKGDEIKSIDESTEISVRHLLGSDKKYITLISGSAELVRGNFVVGEWDWIKVKEKSENFSLLLIYIFSLAVIPIVLSPVFKDRATKLIIFNNSFSLPLPITLLSV